MFARASRPAPDWPTRPPVVGAGGMVATTQPVAASIGVKVLAAGGTAADAVRALGVDRMLDQGHDPQAALDAPRLRVEADGPVDLEQGLAGAADALRTIGYRTRRLERHRAGVGQFVAVDGDRLVGASGRRHDGRAVADG